MNSKSILLVEDNAQDELLILRVLKKVNLINTVDVVRDGQQALDFLFSEGPFSARAGIELPTVVLLDIGFLGPCRPGVLGRLRAASAPPFAASGYPDFVRRRARSPEKL